MTSTADYTETTRRVENAFTTTLDTWKNSLNSVTDQFRALPTVPAFPQVDATEAIERQFAFIQQVVDLNHDYVRKLAEVANTLTGATREQFQSVGNIVRGQIESVSDVARSGADTVEDTVRSQADQVERAENEAREQAEEAERQQAREAAKAERAQRREASAKARERYENLSKAELSDEAAKRDLPKTGTVDELVERLVANDTK
jgi:hypothetical protein